MRELERRLRRLEASVPHPRHQPPELGAEALEAMDARIARMLAPLPDPDSPDWTPAHHAVLVEAAALNRRRWAHSARTTNPGTTCWPTLRRWCRWRASCARRGSRR